MTGFLKLPLNKASTIVQLRGHAGKSLVDHRQSISSWFLMLVVSISIIGRNWEIQVSILLFSVK